MTHVHDIAALDKILARGLCQGSGDGTATFCAEQAVAVICGLPVTDRPDECVTPAVSSYGRVWNDRWRGTDMERATHMRDFLLAQIGSKGVVDGKEFASRLALRTIQRVLPFWLRYGKVPEPLIAACENAKTLADGDVAARAASVEAYKRRAAAAAAAAAAYAADAYAAAYVATADAAAAYAADAAAAAYAAAAAAAAAADAADADADAAAYVAYAVRRQAMLLSILIAVEILKELKSPGCELLVTA